MPSKHGWFCRLCLRHMKRNRWGWFDHLQETDCPGQDAEWLDAD